jgi:hypothetical protein
MRKNAKQPGGNSAAAVRRGGARTRCRRRRTPSIAVDQHPTVAGSRALGGAALGGTNRQHKTHNSSPCEVLYPWHPWHGQLVHIFAIVNQRGIEVRRCHLNANDPGSPLEIPAWMFDRVVCSRMRRVEVPVISFEHLTHLHAFLKEQKALSIGDRVVDDQHRPQSPTGNADGHTRRRIRPQLHLICPQPERPDWPTLPQEVRLLLRQLLSQLLLATHHRRHETRKRREVRDK